jgi:hypothetical protein
MATQIRDIKEIAKKYREVTPLRDVQWEMGVKAPLKDWATQTIAAKDAWSVGVTEAVKRGAFEKGVKAAGTETWQDKAIRVGRMRWSEGVSKFSDYYEKGFAPFRDVIAGVTPPARYRKGDPRNIERVAAYALALRKKKEELG